MSFNWFKTFRGWPMRGSWSFWRNYMLWHPLRLGLHLLYSTWNLEKSWNYWSWSYAKTSKKSCNTWRIINGLLDSSTSIPSDYKVILMEENENLLQVKMIRVPVNLQKRVKKGKSPIIVDNCTCLYGWRFYFFSSWWPSSKWQSEP